ncbi:MAG: flagellar hook-associated protein FlgL [Syntrophorhabdaceae bacterium]|nr:flagellar hook-associated protein FlgL [Syntrophorhabdaceae bacterium]
MRVSTTQIYRNSTDSLMQSVSSLYKWNEQIASGKRINKPSDDVTGAARALDYRVFIENSNRYLSSINSTMNALSYADSTLTAVDTALIRLKELTVEAANGATSDSSRGAIATETEQLRNHILSLANTKMEGTYLFSGFKTDTQAYDSSYNYQGDSGLIYIGVGGGMEVPQNVTGEEVFSYTLIAPKTVAIRDGVYAHYIPQSGPPPSIAVNVSTNSNPSVAPDISSYSYDNAIQLADVLTNAIRNNDMLGISALMGSLDDMSEHVNKVHADLGTRMNGLDSQEVRIRDMRHTTAINLSSIEDADIIETASEFAKASTILSAVQLSTSRILSQSLFDFLR